VNVILATNVALDTPAGVAQYWDRLIRGVKSHGIGVVPMPLADAARLAVPGYSLVIVDNHDALAIPGGVAVVAVQHGCAGEHLARVPGWKAGTAMVPKQAAAGKRGRTFWVGCSVWAAIHCKKHMGVVADRVIYGTVHNKTFSPSARQQSRPGGKPIVLHHCADGNKGSDHVGAVAEALKGRFEFRRLKCKANAVPAEMRKADIWLCLSASEGLPTVLQEAAATGLCCVSTNVGVAWETTTDPWVTTFDWRDRGKPAVVAAAIERAWASHDWHVPRHYADTWWNLPLFGQKWSECLALAAHRLGVAK